VILFYLSYASIHTNLNYFALSVNRLKDNVRGNAKRKPQCLFRFDVGGKKHCGKNKYWLDYL